VHVSSRRGSIGGTHLRVPELFPQWAGLRVERALVLDGVVHVEACRVTDMARCPSCEQHSHRIHSRYTRRIADEPVGGRRVVVHLRVRRFVCRNAGCPRRTFAEQAPSLAPRYARRSVLLSGTLQQIGVALGGRPGARLSRALRRPISRTTLLRLVRALPLPVAPSPRVLGVDDWARRRGRTYGTILVDQERRAAIDLLPDRTAETLATWLGEHPGVEIICRDRAGAYADAARQGAPDAVQVADRWHVLANVGEMVERVLGSHRTALQQAAAAVDRRLVETTPPDARAPAATPSGPPRLTHAQQAQRARRAPRLARYEAVMALHQQGLSQCAIADQVGLGRKTVRRYLRADAFPERARPAARATILAPYDRYLRTRWAEGCHNAHQLWLEIQRQGFLGGAVTVRRYVARWRTHPARRGRSAQRPTALGGSPSRPPTRVLSPRQARWLLLRAWDTLTLEEQTYRTHLLEACAVAREAQQLAEAFGQVMRTQDRPGLSAWLMRAEVSSVPEIRSFAIGLRRDEAAVTAAVTSPWSNGQTEGQVNRLKLLKRQMYGRASFQLLRHRFLLTA
jgi:transposase